jgi:hypothetical protein
MPTLMQSVILTNAGRSLCVYAHLSDDEAVAKMGQPDYRHARQMLSRSLSRRLLFQLRRQFFPLRRPCRMLFPQGIQLRR